MLGHLKPLVAPLIVTAIVGCAAKPKDKPAAPNATLPDRSVIEVAPVAEVAQDQAGAQNVLPSRDESVAALIRKSEEYARDISQAKAPEASPAISEQITVKAPEELQPPLQNQQTQSSVSNETGIIDISRQPALRAPEAADANIAAPMTAGQANIAAAPQVAKVIAQEPAAPAFSSDVLEKRLLARVKEYPRDVSGHLEYQLMQFIKDQPTPELATLSALPEEDRELVAAVMDGLSNFRSQLRADNNMLLSKKIRPMVDLSARLQSQAELNIPSLTLCTKVEGFGRYDPITPPRFIASRDTQVIVYCEVANFTSRVTGENNFWQTDLTQDIVLYSEAGQPVWTDPTSRVQDTSRVRRHDFFVRKLVTLPASLPVGRYLLKVTVTDQQANHVAEASLPLQIVAQ